MVMISRSTIQFIRTALTTNPFRNPFAFKKKEVVSEDVEDENAENEEESPTPVENNDEDSFVFVTEDEIGENEVEMALPNLYALHPETLAALSQVAGILEMKQV